MAADEVQSGLEQIRGRLDHGMKVYAQKGQENVIISWCARLINALAVSEGLHVRLSDDDN